LILLTYHKWGEESPKFLVGDFAFMIWDERKQKLFGARDFSGSRTLYYYSNQSQFAFSTVIHPLFTSMHLEKRINEQWMAEFLAISGVVDTVDTFLTVYKNIYQLPPSHTIKIQGNKIKLSRYCTLVAGKQLNLKSNTEYEEAFREVFQSAVNSRLRTQRNVGAHLSGGLDSGSVVSFAVKALRPDNKQLHTFSYLPPEDFVDFTPKSRMANERPFIQSTIEHVGGITEHYLDFKGKSPFAEIDELLETMEMPYKFFENSIWLKGIFEQAHNEGIGILLNGGRGNFTISWGPALEYYAELLKQLKWFHLAKEINMYSKNLGVKKTRVFPLIGKIAFPFINHISPLFEQYDSPTLINTDLAKRTGVFEKLKEHGMNSTGASLPNIFNERKRHFEELFHWSATNTIGTKLSLRYSLWKRDPTNDIRVIRFCLAVPEEQYVQNGLDRALVRRATKNLLPDKVRLNQRIRGVQGVDWVHRMAPSWDLFVEELHQLSNDTRIFEYLNEKVVKDSILSVKDGPRSDFAIKSDYRISMRSLIVFRFLKNLI
ncbi:MAG: glutamine amidotransferase domain protein, partial [Neobacillus sp.]|jgi:asparagine synthase (glutamine-hydrolysing)|nr:glutamine amidotransferase domain protein [Neobacillus sp.]